MKCTQAMLMKFWKAYQLSPSRSNFSCNASSVGNPTHARMLAGGDGDDGPLDPGGAALVTDLLEQSLGGLHHVHRCPEVVGDEALE